MVLSNVMMSSKNTDWETPNCLIATIFKSFRVGLDVCATSDNAKSIRYYGLPDKDGLKESWVCEENCVAWCNPPYGREVPKWVDKAIYEHEKQGANILLLVAARTDTKWFQKLMKTAKEILFFKGRLKFEGAPSSAPFPSALILLSDNDKMSLGNLDSRGTIIKF